MDFDVRLKMIGSITRLLAGILGVLGLYWAFLLIVSVAGGIGIYLNFIHLPGWACFIGWWLIALGKPLPMPEKVFWILSIFAHLWLLAHSYFMFGGSRLEGGWQQGSTGIGIALAVSLICALLQWTVRKQPNDEQAATLDD